MSTLTAVTELAARVRRRLAPLHPGEPLGRLETLPGGHSGLTYSITAGPARYVVKAVPPGQRPVGRNDVLRQARMLYALAGSPVPVPGVVAVDEREPAWFAMEFVPGEAVEPVLDEHRLDPALCRTRMLGLAPVLRGLHQAEARGPAPAAPDALDPAGELERWSRTMRAVPAELRPGADELLPRLAATAPPGLPPVLTHGDFRLGNVLCRGKEAAAVVDWEIWGAGDPRTDLGWFLLFTDHRNFPAWAARSRACRARASCWTPTWTAVPRRPPSTGSAPWPAPRWPRSWATTCGGTGRASTTTRTRSGCRPPLRR